MADEAPAPAPAHTVDPAIGRTDREQLVGLAANMMSDLIDQLVTEKTIYGDVTPLTTSCVFAGVTITLSMD